MKVDPALELALTMENFAREVDLNIAIERLNKRVWCISDGRARSVSSLTDKHVMTVQKYLALNFIEADVRMARFTWAARQIRLATAWLTIFEGELRSRKLPVMRVITDANN